jgi:hypothetical protein
MQAGMDMDAADFRTHARRTYRLISRASRPMHFDDLNPILYLFQGTFRYPAMVRYIQGWTCVYFLF